MIKLKTGQIVKLRNNMLFIAVNVKGKLILVNEDGLYDEGHDSDLKCPNDKQWDVVSVYYSPLGISFDCIEKPLLLIKNRGLIVDGNYKLECWYSTDLEQKVTTLEWQIFEDMVVKYYETGKWWIDDDIDKYMKTDKPEFKDDKIRIPEGYYGLGSIYALREKLEKRLLNEKIHKDIEALRKLVKAFAKNNKDIEALRKLVKAFAKNNLTLSDGDNGYVDDFRWAVEHEWITLSDYNRILSMDEGIKLATINKMAEEYKVKIEN